jgi:uncharacterized protein YkwD
LDRFTDHTRVLLGCLAAVAIVTVSAAPAGGSVGAKVVHRTTHHRNHRPVRRPAPKPSVPAQCPKAKAPATSSSLSTMRAAVVCLVNQQRMQHGLPALATSHQLNRSAQGWTTAMVQSGRFTHGPGDAFASRISAAGYNWQTAGENIATGFPTPRSVVSAWMASPDHCRNILDPSFRDVGTGETGSAVGDVASGPATWTQDFGLRMSQSAPSHNEGPMNGCPY